MAGRPSLRLLKPSGVLATTPGVYAATKNNLPRCAKTARAPTATVSLQWGYVSNEGRRIRSLKQKVCHVDEFFITGCAGGCHHDNLQCSHWWKIHQHNSLFHFHHGLGLLLIAITKYKGQPICLWLHVTLLFGSVGSWGLFKWVCDVKCIQTWNSEMFMLLIAYISKLQLSSIKWTDVFHKKPCNVAWEMFAHSSWLSVWNYTWYCLDILPYIRPCIWGQLACKHTKYFISLLPVSILSDYKYILNNCCN